MVLGKARTFWDKEVFLDMTQEGGNPGHGCSELGNSLACGEQELTHCWTNKHWLVSSVDAN